MIELFKKRVPRKMLVDIVRNQEQMIRSMCGELCQSKAFVEKIAGLFSPAEKDLLMHSKEDVICAPGLYGTRGYFARESLVGCHYGFTEDEAERFIDLVHEMAERREEGT